MADSWNLTTSHMAYPVLIFVVFLAPLVWVTIRGKDAWPFSHYPMFSGSKGLDQVELYRVLLERTGGEVNWWSSEFYRYPEYVGRLLKRTYEQESDGGRTAAFALLERQRCLSEVLRVIEEETGDLAAIQAIHIVRRTVDSKSDEIVIVDQRLARIPLDEIKRVNGGD